MTSSTSNGPPLRHQQSVSASLFIFQLLLPDTVVALEDLATAVAREDMEEAKVAAEEAVTVEHLVMEPWPQLEVTEANNNQDMEPHNNQAVMVLEPLQEATELV